MAHGETLHRCGCTYSDLTFWEDPPRYRYEIVFCKKCKAGWAYDYDPRIGSVEPGTVPRHLVVKG